MSEQLEQRKEPPTPIYDSLPPRKQRFVDKLIAGDNPTQAYKRKGVTRPSASNGGSKWMSQSEIQGAFRERKALAVFRAGLEPAAILKEYARLGYSDFRDVAEWTPDGKVKLTASSELTTDAARAIQAIETTTTRSVSKAGRKTERVTTKVKLHAKKPALDKLGEHTGLFPKEQQGDRPVLIVEHIDNVTVAVPGGFGGGNDSGGSGARLLPRGVDHPSDSENVNDQDESTLINPTT